MSKELKEAMRLADAYLGDIERGLFWDIIKKILTPSTADEIVKELNEYYTKFIWEYRKIGDNIGQFAGVPRGRGNTLLITSDFDGLMANTNSSSVPLHLFRDIIIFFINEEE